MIPSLPSNQFIWFFFVRDFWNNFFEQIHYELYKWAMEGLRSESCQMWDRGNNIQLICVWSDKTTTIHHNPTNHRSPVHDNQVGADTPSTKHFPIVINRFFGDLYLYKFRIDMIRKPKIENRQVGLFHNSNLKRHHQFPINV